MRAHICAFAILAINACQPPPPRPFDIEVHTLTDEDEPLGAVAVSIEGQEVGSTDASGQLLLRRHEAEGTHLKVSVEVPRGYKLIEDPRPLVLQRISRMVNGATRELPNRLVIRFGPVQRNYAVLIDVGAPNLPVETFGKQQTVTNSRGVASFIYTGAPGDELVVHVSSETDPAWRSKVVSANFVLAPTPEVYVVEGRFDPRSKQPEHKRRHPIVRHKPPKRLT